MNLPGAASHIRRLLSITTWVSCDLVTVNVREARCPHHRGFRSKASRSLCEFFGSLSGAARQGGRLSRRSSYLSGAKLLQKIHVT